MRQVVIENPVLNSPYAEPQRHFRFTEQGITDEIVEARRVSSYFVPIPQPKKKGKQAALPLTEWTEDRIEENTFINQLRERVARWRQNGYRGVTPTTAYLLNYWQRPDRERKLFFCQIEALETAIYVTEVATKDNAAWIENALRAANDSSNPGLYRIAVKMATGSGKTVVMAMLIAWQALNKLANTQDARFSDAFLIVTPGITIRDRLRVLLPSDPDNYYRKLDVVPPDMLEDLGRARFVITNFHAFKPREHTQAGKLTKAILDQGKASPFTETPDQMVRRVCRELGAKKNIVVLNDEAHHCYRRKPDADADRLSGDERREAERREEEARVWISGLEAVKAKLGVKVIYDLSATPFFLRGSGYTKLTADGKRITEGILFPWVVSDFSLIDAIESGIVKVPRVPVADDSMVGEQPTYRDLWLRIRDGLPKKGRGTQEVTGEPKLPAELEGALQSLYGNYEKYYAAWERNTAARAAGLTPPVFIVVCNNTNVSKLVFQYIAGWEKRVDHGAAVRVPGQLKLFSNVADGRWLPRPNTILVDSEELESGESMSDEFKKLAAAEIEEFKADYRRRFPGRDTDALTDEDLLREVMNTVGKPGKLGEGVRCVVSVSMLTEGWDANTVTHILGIRAFGTQLLCEQVVGRALRRMSYAIDSDNKFAPEYAEVYGVPFSFIPSEGAAKITKPPAHFTRVHALEDRIAAEITFPRLLGYRYDLPGERLAAEFTPASRYALSTADLPTRTDMSSIIGESTFHDLYDLRLRREQEIDFHLARRVLETYFRDGEGALRPWLFPQLLPIVGRWRQEYVTCKDNAFPQMLLIVEFANDAASHIYQAIVHADHGVKTLKPILRPYDTLGSTRYVDFDTARETYLSSPALCHVSHVVLDSGWEAKMAESLEEMPEVVAYVKNQGLGFTIPYTLNGEERSYIPDFIVRINDGRDDPLNLIVEVSGEKKKDKAQKVTTARELWIPAVNNHGGFGRWAFIESSDPWDAKNTIRAFLAAGR
ncbi:MAG: DEAD/DEAH box helicase family protein [Anaerolineae bacterium]